MRWMTRWGITVDNDKKRKMRAAVTGEMVNGRKVWTECNRNGDLINMNKQYTLKKSGKLNVFTQIEEEQA